MAKGVGDVLYSILSNDTNISAIVGTKIYPFLAIEDVVYPYIVYTIEGVDPTQTDDGVSILDVNSANIEIYSEDLSENETLSKYVRNALDRYKGTVEGIEVQSISFRSEGGGYADADRVYLKIQDYSLRMVTASCMFSRVTDLAASSISESQIDLTWTDVATGETGWEIWTSQDFINWTLVDTIAADSTSYSNTGLDSETSYSYKIRAIDSTDNGEWSNITIGCTESVTVPKVGIAYDYPQPTNQIISYYVGDTAWNEANLTPDTQPSNPLYIQSLADNYTLNELNEFGNYHRYTTQDGTLAISDTVYASPNTVIDHLTGREWAFNNIVIGINWFDAIDNCTSLNAEGFDDWYMPSINEWLQMINTNGSQYNLTTDLISGNLQMWSCNTNFSSTNDALFIFSLSSFVNSMSRVSKTGNQNIIPIRKRY